MNTNIIRDNTVVKNDPWQIVHLAPSDEQPKKLTGKVVLFKRTAENHVTPTQVLATHIPEGKVIIPLSVWQAKKVALQKRLEAGELGVWLDSHELIEDLLASSDDINALPVIAFRFERLADGRGYSAAALLRTRHGFKNELRAWGDILRDQLFSLRRCGFNAYQIRADRCAHEALTGLSDFSDPYQHAADGLLPLWRRYVRGAPTV